MTRLTLCAAAALAACSSEPQRNAASPAPAAAPSTASIPPGATPTAGQDSGAKPMPGALKTFGDWAAGCDNTLRCELRSLAPEGEVPGDVAVSVAREPGPAGKVSVNVGSEDEDGLAASVDGKAAQTPGALAAAMANGRALAALSAGRVIANVSLQGASAALRYMDVEQGRAGTVTALVAKGLKPARAVPAPPTPVIVALTPGGTPAAPRPNQLAAMRRAAACDGEQRDKPEFHALGGGQTLVLLPCSAGAYNLSQALFVLNGKGFVPARSDAPVGFADGEKQPVPTVVNGRWEKAMLTSHAKGRGIGDCGVSQEFVWDGTRLRLSRQREMGECRGNIDYITTWRADVVRR